jgi:hypothetical protein
LRSSGSKALRGKHGFAKQRSFSGKGRVQLTI